MFFQVTKGKENMKQHVLFKHGAKHACPYPGCNPKPMLLKSLQRHWNKVYHGDDKGDLEDLLDL